MKCFATVIALASSASAFAPVLQGQKAMQLASAKADLEVFANKANPIVNYYDPLSLADANFWDQGDDATIGFLRHAEIKHGRVAMAASLDTVYNLTLYGLGHKPKRALLTHLLEIKHGRVSMAAFVGYCVQSNFVWPWAQTQAGAAHPSVDLGPEAQWDAIPAAAKWQIILVVGFLELWGEIVGTHYMRGGKPGDYPTFQLFRDNVHFVLDLYDPFGFSKKMSEEKKAERLVMEVNNGRLAMLGIFGFLSADTIPGSVPLLKSIAIPYDGSVMAPFAPDFHIF
eukprot:CAMPEP_0194392682 /NCGR_PEP_ID=MMETSP0174-20130528/122875_1 /TAXON_ID=216777 /ORGANISM="Proboscia alata, Strain PI-D3" /LENGTH=282 /DNA_ID=CAMNT_0039188277 /DNA_START=43 /DNA_END=892 /DNA_ORIENTATION=+